MIKSCLVESEGQMNKNTIIAVLMIILVVMFISNYRNDHKSKTMTDRVEDGFDEIGHELDEVGDKMEGDRYD
jgi:hypothetical protein